MVIILKKSACMRHAHYMHARTHLRPSFCFLNKITHLFMDRLLSAQYEFIHT